MATNGIGHSIFSWSGSIFSPGMYNYYWFFAVVYIWILNRCSGNLFNSTRSAVNAPSITPIGALPPTIAPVPGGPTPIGRPTPLPDPPLHFPRRGNNTIIGVPPCLFQSVLFLDQERVPKRYERCCSCYYQIFKNSLKGFVYTHNQS